MVGFASTVFEGKAHTSPPDPRYQDGVKMSLFNSAAFSGVTLVFSLVLPLLIRPPVGVKGEENRSSNVWGFP